jgi:putative restriction endonuclease
VSDESIRLLALNRVRELRDLWGDAIPESEIAKGFLHDGEMILLKGQQGIFKPRQLKDGPLTLMSTLGSRYEDELLDEANTVKYDYAPPSREYENEGLKNVMRAGSPVILLKQVKAKPRPEYMVVAPLYVEGFDNAARQFMLSTRADLTPAVGTEAGIVLREINRAYGETTVQTRLHQAYFRRDVLRVYKTKCCVCELRTRPLLQGAHIVPDSAAQGIAAVQNGLSLCSLHHAAYDRDILRINSDYRVSVEQQWIESDDDFGRVALSDFHGRRIELPSDPAHHPNPDFLGSRFSR